MVATNTHTYASLAEVSANLIAAISTAVDNLELLKKIEFETDRQEERMLEDIVDAIKPVLKYIDKPYAIKKVIASDRRHYEEYEELQERAVPLIEKHGWRQRGASGGFETYYGGYALLLTRSGTFVDLTYTGGKDQESGSHSREAKVTVLSVHDLLEMYRYGSVMWALSEVFQQALRDIELRKSSLERRLKIIESVNVS